jgi:hypothetical protein
MSTAVARPTHTLADCRAHCEQARAAMKAAVPGSVRWLDAERWVQFWQAKAATLAALEREAA